MFVEDKQGQQNVAGGQKPNVPLTHSHKSSPCFLDPKVRVRPNLKQIAAGRKSKRLLKETLGPNLSFEMGVSSFLLLA